MALRILLVDDDPHIRGHLAALLGDFPNVIVAGSVSSGAETISFLRRAAVDLIFLDIEMGDVSGFDLARHIQSAYPKIMLVFLTGHVDFALNGYEFQPLDFLIKPVNPLRLERVILQAEELLGKRRQKTPSVRVGLQVGRSYKWTASSILRSRAARSTSYRPAASAINPMTPCKSFRVFLSSMVFSAATSPSWSGWMPYGAFT